MNSEVWIERESAYEPEYLKSIYHFNGQTSSFGEPVIYLCGKAAVKVKGNLNEGP